MGMCPWSLSGGTVGQISQHVFAVPFPSFPLSSTAFSTSLSPSLVAVCSWPSCFSAMSCVVAAVAACCLQGGRCLRSVLCVSRHRPMRVFAAALMVLRFDRLGVTWRF